MTGRTSTAPSQAAGIRAALDRLVQVGALQHVVAGEDLFGLGVRAVAGHDVPALAAADADGRRRRGRVAARVPPRMHGRAAWPNSVYSAISAAPDWLKSMSGV